MSFLKGNGPYKQHADEGLSSRPPEAPLPAVPLQ